MKCLVTKLNGSISNDGLLKLGELRIYVPTAASSYMEIYAAMKNDGKIVSNKDFLYGNAQGTVSKGKEVSISAGGDNGAFASPNESFVSILKKYGLTKLIVKGGLFIKLGNLDYCDNLSSITIQDGGNEEIGDISELMLAKKLTSFWCVNQTKLIGDIASIAAHPSLATINIAGTNVLGNIDDFSLNSSIKELFLQRTKIGGDISKMPSNLKVIASTNEGQFSWSTERDNSFPIITLENVYLGKELDNMLINQAKCPASDNSYKVIMCKGTRTSASDEAISTLQSKGYTVSIS